MLTACVAIATAIVYLPRLGNAPIYLSKDEVFSSLTAQSLAATGRDLAGRFLPLYSQGLGVDFWFPPVLTYAIALVLEVVPFSEATVRLPMVAAAIVDVLLVFWIAKRLTRRTWPAVGAAALMALTPAHFLISRHAQDPAAPLPFVLGWLLCMVLFVERHSRGALCIGGLLLGVAAFSYVGATVLMPLYLLLTFAVLLQRRERWDSYLATGVGFLIPICVSAPWLIAHGEALGESFLHYQSETVKVVGESNSLGAALAYYRLGHVLSLYGNFWNTRFLFIDGSPILAFSTNQAGVFVLAVAGLFVAGLIGVLRGRVPAALAILLLGALVLAPVPASLVDVDEVAAGRAIWRAAEVIPIVALVAGIGLDSFWTLESTNQRRLLWLVAGALPLILISAYRDFLPDPEALHRTAAAPLLAAGIMMVADLWQTSPWRRSRMNIAATAVGTLVAIHVAYLVARSSPATRAALDIAVPLTLAACMVLVATTTDRVAERAGAALIGLLAAQFTYLSIDYAHEHLLKGLFALAALAVMLATIVVRSTQQLPSVRNGADPQQRTPTLFRNSIRNKFVSFVVSASNDARSETAEVPDRGFGSAVLALVACQVFLFVLDSTAAPRWRLAGGLVVGAAVVWCATRYRGTSTDRVRLGQLAAAGIFTLAILQFGSFYVDYFTDYRRRFAASHADNTKGALEAAIDYATHRPVPSIYLGFRYVFGPQFWRFYLLKHHREDLLARTVVFDPDQVASVPGGSLIVTPIGWPITDRAIESMVRTGQMRVETVIREVDGRPIYWVVERQR